MPCYFLLVLKIVFYSTVKVNILHLKSVLIATSKFRKNTLSSVFYDKFLLLRTIKPILERYSKHFSMKHITKERILALNHSI